MSRRFAVRLSVSGEIRATNEEGRQRCTVRLRLSNLLGMTCQLVVPPSTFDPFRVPATWTRLPETA